LAGGSGGGASLSSSITGTTVVYAKPGAGGDYGATLPVADTPGSGGRGGSALSGGQSAGANGICVYRYRIG
jgi:hypothetical protein